MRKKLPNRRAGITITFRHNNHTYHGSTGEYDDGKIGEVFLTAGKSGTHLSVTTHDASIATSIALQHGATIQELSKACIKNEDGSPAGALGKMLQMLVKIEKEGK